MRGKPFIETLGTKAGLRNTDKIRAKIQHRRIAAGLRPVQDWDGEPIGFVDARINHGIWLVDCPTEGCTNAEMVDPIDWRLFVCSQGCDAGATVPLRVDFPLDRDRIEELLLRRIRAEDRNWKRGELAEHLELETAIMQDDARLFPLPREED